MKTLSLQCSYPHRRDGPMSAHNNAWTWTSWWNLSSAFARPVFFWTSVYNHLSMFYLVYTGISLHDYVWRQHDHDVRSREIHHFKHQHKVVWHDNSTHLNCMYICVSLLHLKNCSGFSNMHNWIPHLESKLTNKNHAQCRLVISVTSTVLACILMDSIFLLWQLEGKGSCDVNIDQSAGSMVM